MRPSWWVDGDLVARASALGDTTRRRPAGREVARTHKEWLHFCVFAEGLDLLVNFSLVDAPAGGAGPAEHARITLLARDAAGWHGEVITAAPGDVDARRGQVGLRFGRDAAFFDAGAWRLTVRGRTLDLEVDLLVEPAAFPSIVNNVATGDGPPIHWLVVPRNFARGRVRLGGVTHTLDRAAAYHDHNWGEFGWGRDFAWEWGYALPADPAVPWSLVFVRLSDRGHTRTRMQGLFLWDGVRESRVLRGPQLTVRQEGLRRPGRVLKIPPVMGLLFPEASTGVPERWIVEGQDRGDEVRLVFETDQVAQVIVPADEHLGATLIQEISGTVAVQGRVRGVAFAFTAPGVFELLGD